MAASSNIVKANGSADKADGPLLPHLESWERMMKLPVMEAAWSQSQEVYDKMRGELNDLLNWRQSVFINHAIGVNQSRKFEKVRLHVPVHVSFCVKLHNNRSKTKKKVLKSNYSRNDAVVCRSSNSRRVDWLVNCLKVMTHELPIRIRNLIDSSQRDQLRNRSKSYDAGTKFSTDVWKKTLKSMIMSSALWCCKLNPLRCVVVGALDFF